MGVGDRISSLSVLQMWFGCKDLWETELFHWTTTNASILIFSYNLYGIFKLQYQKQYTITALHFVTLLTSYYSYTTSDTFLPHFILNSIFFFLGTLVIIRWVFSHWIAKSWYPQYVELRSFYEKKTEMMYIFSLMTNTKYSIFHLCCNL